MANNLISYPNIELSDIEAGRGGFVINGVSAWAQSGNSVSTAGDVNGDGLDDLIVGAPYDSASTFQSGAGYVVFGKSDGTAAVDLVKVANGNGGFVIKGASWADHAGWSVSAAGDVNGDGLGDLIIGAPHADPNGSVSGASFVVFGKSDRTAVDLSVVEAGTGGFVINGVEAFDESGHSVSNAGDVNGDGMDDLIVGASGDDPNGGASGASFVVFGKSDGTAADLSAVEAGMGGFVINGVSASDQSGHSVSNAGDVNGDGLYDLIVGAPFDDPNGISSGASFVVFGKSNSTAVELSAVEAGIGGFVINGVGAGDRSGWSVSNAGDVNADGLDDLIVGAPYDNPNGSDSGASFVVFGKSDSTAVELSAVEAGTGGFVINGISNVSYLASRAGFSVSTAGDVNGDGLDDLIVETPYDSLHGFHSGASFVVFGKSDNTTAVELSAVKAGTGGFELYGASAGDKAGGSVSNAGDVNGDGLDDLIIGAHADDPHGSGSGASFVVFGVNNVIDLDAGSDTGTSSTDNLTSDTTPTINFVAEAGAQVEIDWDDGNGFANAGLGTGAVQQATLASPYASDSTKTIQVRVTDAASTVTTTSLVVTIDTTAPAFLLPAVELSDVEAGIGGFVINGMPGIFRSGFSVSNAGDINGDGLDDLIVGAPYDDPKGHWSGTSFVVFGKSAGTAVELSAVEAGTGGFVISGVSAGDLSGISVSNAGDVNGDGVEDLIVGAFRDDPNGTNSGASFVVFGKSDSSAVELSSVEAGNGGFVINGVSAGDEAGRFVSNAGDVNGDGLDDLIVAAIEDDPNGTRSGASFVVFGKSDGTAVELSAVEAGSGGFVINGVSAQDASGNSVSNAGDVNGDGLDDVIVGAIFDGPNGFRSGASFVVFGKSAGTAVELSVVEAGTGGFVINGVSAGDGSGIVVSSAGDVNGDGLDDLLVGTWDDDPNGSGSGASFVVFGKSAGTAVELSAVEAGTGGFVINGVSAGDLSGNSVSNAGDVNGDGLDDVIVGAWGDDPNGSRSGASFVVFGKSDGTAVELSDVEAGTGGFVINGVSAGDGSGISVSNAGDVNGDGQDDLIVSAHFDDPNGVDSGASFVVFGSANPVRLDPASDTGASSTDNITSDTTPTIIFGLEAGAAVEIDWDDGNGFVRAGTGTSAIQQITIPSPYGIEGDHTIQVRATDLAGNVSVETLTITINFPWTEGPDIIDFSAAATPQNIFGLGGNDILTGGSAGDTIMGDAGDDTVYGRGGNDALFGGSGNDFLIGGAGGDAVDGGTGQDRAQYHQAGPGLRADIGFSNLNTGEAKGDTYTGIEDLFGSSFNDILGGDNAANVLSGYGGNDTIYARGGADILNGGDGDDFLYGDGGNDILSGNAGRDRLDGGSGTDLASYLTAASGILADIAFIGSNSGDAASDQFISIENLEGTNHDDSLRGDSNANAVWGHGGNDTIYGRGGNDALSGGNGDDFLIGGAGGDALDGGFGQDRAQYHQASSGLHADLSATQVNTGKAAGDTYTGIEDLFGSKFNDILAGNDLANVVSGYDGDDILFGRGGADTPNGGAGDDVLIGGAGVDAYNGGTGTDRVQYQEFSTGLRVDLQNPAANTGAATGETFFSIEDLVGSSGNDFVLGNAQANRLHGFDGVDRVFGRAGNDTLFGGSGNDILNGGADNDVLVGGQGADTFAFDGANFGSDRIADFTPGETIDLTFYTGLTFADLTIADVAGRAEISFASGDIVLTGIQAANVISAWFDFAP